jgi:hypothetical protein
MVQASTLLIAAFSIAPVLAAPLSQASTFERSYDEASGLEVRDPKFRLGGFLKKVGGIAKTAIKITNPVAGLLLRDVDGNIDVRDFDFDNLSERDLQELEELAERDPKFRLGRLLKKVGGIAKTALKVANPVAGLLLRDVDGTVYVRDIDLEDLSERELYDLEELAERDPKFKFGSFLKKVGGIAGKGLGIAAKIGLGLRELEEAGELDARDLAHLEELLEREFGDMSELDARDPKFRLGNILKKVGGVARKASGIAGQVAGIAGSLGLREFEETTGETRSFDDLD